MVRSGSVVKVRVGAGGVVRTGGWRGWVGRISF